MPPGYGQLWSQVLVCAVLGSAGTGCTSGAAGEGEELGQLELAVELSGTATASSVQGGYVAANAVDGSASTRWGSAFSDPQWIAVDLGSTQSINRVVLNWEAAYS